MSRQPPGRSGSRIQMLDLDEGEIERIGVDDVVLDARPPRVGNMQLQRHRARAAAGLLEKQVSVGERNDNIIGLMSMPSCSAPGANLHSVTRTCGSEMWTWGAAFGLADIVPPLGRGTLVGLRRRD